MIDLIGSFCDDAKTPKNLKTAVNKHDTRV